MTNKQKALLLMVLSTFSFSLMQLLVKLMSGSIPTMELVFARNFVTLLLGAYLIIKRESSFFGKKENRTALFLRSIFGFIGVWGYFYATQNMNVADASLLHRSSPFFVLILSSIFLKTKLTWVQLISIIIAFAGAILVINPSMDSMNSMPAIIGLISAAGAGAAYVIINYLKGKEANETIIFCFSLISCVLSVLVGFKDFVVPSFKQLIMLLFLGILAGIGQIALTKAYKMANPGEVSIVNYLGIVFSAILGFVVLGEVLNTRTIIGIACIFSAALLLYFIKESKEVFASKKPDTGN